MNMLQYLEKNVPSGKLFWKIEVVRNVTTITSGRVGGPVKKHAPVRHRSVGDAVRYVETQSERERAAGFHNLQKRSVRRSHSFTPPSTNDNYNEGDTDSVASSLSLAGPSHHINQPHLPEPKQVGTGVSPLNRRRSLRLAEKQASIVASAGFPIYLHQQDTVRMWDAEKEMNVPHLLRGQNTIKMESVRSIKAMETASAWLSHRGQRPRLTSEDTLLQPALSRLKRKNTSRLPHQQSRRRLYPTDISDLTPVTNIHIPSKRFPTSMMKKQSTTAGLRSMLASTGLKSIHPSAADEVDAGLLECETSTSKLKGKATSTLLSPTLSKPSKQFKSKGSKKVTVMKPGEEPVFTTAIKRKLSLGMEDIQSDRENPRKKKKLKAKSAEETDAVQVYIPPNNNWPLEMNAQIVWTVPLKDEAGKPKHALGIFVNSNHCLIGDEEGKVMELDASVVPRHSVQLPSGVKCLYDDDTGIYAGCDDGGVYDLSQSSPRLVCFIKGFGQILKVVKEKNRLGISDHHGNVAVVDADGKVQWKRKSDGEFGWMIQIDDSGVYHGHSCGVTKYNAENGKVLWNSRLHFGIMSGSQNSCHLYVASGAEVIKICKSTGETEQTYCKGTPRTAAVHSMAIASGVVFAGGNNLVCYDEDTGDVIYIMKLPNSPKSMQYYCGRLFCLGLGALNVLDFTAPIIKAALDGSNVEPVEVSPDPKQPKFTSLKRVKTITPRNIKVRAASKDVNKSKQRKTISKDSSPKPRRGMLKGSAKVSL